MRTENNESEVARTASSTVSPALVAPSTGVYPVITLYQPWATWIMRGWKTIETRTHNKFECLRNKTILIHAGQVTDASAINNPYLTKEQLIYKPEEVINGYILGSAKVDYFTKLHDVHSKAALIDCGSTGRYGLFLTDVKKFESPISVKGQMGIWYYDLSARKKVSKYANLPSSI